MNSCPPLDLKEDEFVFLIGLKMEAVINEHFSVTFLQAWRFAKRVARYGSSNSR